jgi:hypothetical protein
MYFTNLGIWTGVGRQLDKSRKKKTGESLFRLAKAERRRNRIWLNRILNSRITLLLNNMLPKKSDQRSAKVRFLKRKEKSPRLTTHSTRMSIFRILSLLETRRRLIRRWNN